MEEVCVCIEQKEVLAIKGECDWFVRRLFEQQLNWSQVLVLWGDGGEEGRHY